MLRSSVLTSGSALHIITPEGYNSVLWDRQTAIGRGTLIRPNGRQCDGGVRGQGHIAHCKSQLRCQHPTRTD